MAYPSGLTKLIFSGTLPNGEIFSWGFQWDLSSDPSQLANLAASAVAQFNVASPFGVASSVPTTVVHNTLTAYLYSGGPHATSSTVINFTNAGTAGTQPLPNQVACVVTLLTGFPGRSKRGRFYYPLLGAALTSGQYSSTVVNALSSGVANFLSAVRSGMTTPTGHAVVGSATTGAMTQITAVKVDSKPDTQRRRAMKETIANSKITVLP